MDVPEFRKLPILGILRGISPEVIDPLAEAIRDAGMRTVEITMNTAGAPDLIRTMVKRYGRDLTIGAGTVLSLRDLGTALDAGATFVVSPVLIKEVVDECVRSKIPVFPGALTPQDIYEAWEAGATMVKVFPARFFGPEYFREIKGPFGNIELMACAGVTPENAETYFRNGASAIAIGSGTFRKEWIDSGSFSKITEAVKPYLAAFKNRTR